MERVLVADTLAADKVSISSRWYASWITKLKVKLGPTKHDNESRERESYGAHSDHRKHNCPPYRNSLTVNCTCQEFVIWDLLKKPAWFCEGYKDKNVQCTSV